MQREATATSMDAADTTDYVAAHAAERPAAVALIDNVREISYAQFSRDIGKLTAALRDLGLPRGSTAAIACGNLYTHWLLLLACEQLNVATASFDSSEGPATYADLLANVDLVLTDTHLGQTAAKREFAITTSWVRDALARGSAEALVREPQSPDDIVRILRTSGTTGRLKRIALTRRMYELRAVRYGEQHRFTRESRYLLTLPFSIGPSYGCATACLRAGGCVVRSATADSDVVFAKYGITHVTLTPHSLKNVLDRLPADFTKPANLTIFASGSALPDQLAERALSSLATEVFDNFGANEIGGGISFRQMSLRNNFAPVNSGVEVEVVNESGQPLPSGEPGQLRVKSESMVHGYLDDPEATRRFFRDGWFYPSDVAVLDGPRRLKVIGRADEMITTAGGKYWPGDLEALVMSGLKEGDVGICMLADKAGNPQIYVAVAGVRIGKQELLEQVTRAWSKLSIGNYLIVGIDAIPRNAAGKIQRARLKEAIAERLRRL